MRFTTFAPAKVNLVLRVGAPRLDGYHDILTLMAPLDLGDGVDVRVSPRAGPVTCHVPGRPELCGEANLATRAALAFLRRFGLRNAIAIRIDKRTPVTAGLGGGSSDAAAVVRCLARAFRVREREALHEIALSVGSDVPFFLGPGPAWAAGRGERLRPVDVPPLPVVLLFPENPAFAIRAGDAYAWLDEARQGRLARPLGRPGRFSPSRAGNDLEQPCLVHRPALAPLLGRLREAGALVAMMSGSGPTVFGVFSGWGAAHTAALTIARDEFSRLQLRVLEARTVRRQPRVTAWTSPRSASSLSTRRSSRRTSPSRSTAAS